VNKRKYRKDDYRRTGVKKKMEIRRNVTRAPRRARRFLLGQSNKIC